TSPRVSIAVGGVATLAACIPLALRYSRRGEVRATEAVLMEQPDAEPGEVVDFAPGPLIDSRREQVQPPLRGAGSA
ncbi:MAG TPA: hypothetical protein VIH64_13770, partial [Streptosporangiaceae bacterium]